MTTATQKPRISAIAKELRRIYNAHGRRLHPNHVVDEARDPDNILHGQFNWDDAKAAEEHRLDQARRLIATVRITVPMSSKETRTIRAYHSLRSDQNGYRHMQQIVEAPDLLESLVAQFAQDLERMTERYDMLRDVKRTRNVFSVIEEFCGSAKKAS